MRQAEGPLEARSCEQMFEQPFRLGVVWRRVPGVSRLRPSSGRRRSTPRLLQIEAFGLRRRHGIAPRGRMHRNIGQKPDATAPPHHSSFIIPNYPTGSIVTTSPLLRSWSS
jgi:hypothetical protein